jgi:ABC-type hemin transport system ATPase subunit
MIIFLTGPIGAGKSTLGRALAAQLGGHHIEGDDYQLPDRPWYAAALRVARSILRDALSEAKAGRPAIISYPLRCREWLYLKRHCERAGFATRFVALQADPDRIVSPLRGRTFSAWEQQRIREMVDQGYDRPAFADAVVRTDRDAVDESLRKLIAALGPGSR